MRDFQVLMLVLALLVLGFVYVNINPYSPCVVVITGESVRIVSCEFTPEFVALARDLRPAGSC
ncbi:triple gene block protein 3 [Atractylodes mottle virus]|uniref:Movement protein TGBp3 n=1 Tax=Atractylodes mottle virus TaxID=1702121 RepID=A0A0K2BMS8_9VIRU|nr:triple gene block protein 3 [Atractylodes mottle virus]AKZ66617.1 triple gene block protein 3 [Atractylodes mottle virus]